MIERKSNILLSEDLVYFWISQGWKKKDKKTKSTKPIVNLGETWVGFETLDKDITVPLC